MAKLIVKDLGNNTSNLTSTGVGVMNLMTGKVYAEVVVRNYQVCMFKAV